MSVIYGIPFIILGGKTIATISVSYPVGSTCSCSDGKKTFIAADTTGSTVFEIPYVGTWVVSCTNGSKTASKSVSITTEGQTETVKLAYELVLYESGKQLVTFGNASVYNMGSGSIDWDNSSFTMYRDNGTVSGSFGVTAIYSALIDASAYSTANINYKLNSGVSGTTIASAISTSHSYSGYTSALPQSYILSKEASISTASSGTQTIDLTSTTKDISSVYFCFGLTVASYNGGNSCTITKIWLE